MAVKLGKAASDLHSIISITTSNQQLRLVIDSVFDLQYAGFLRRTLVGDCQSYQTLHRIFMLSRSHHRRNVQVFAGCYSASQQYGSVDSGTNAHFGGCKVAS